MVVTIPAVQLLCRHAPCLRSKGGKVIFTSPSLAALPPRNLESVPRPFFGQRGIAATQRSCCTRRTAPNLGWRRLGPHEALATKVAVYPPWRVQKLLGKPALQDVDDKEVLLKSLVEFGNRLLKLESMTAHDVSLLRLFSSMPHRFHASPETTLSQSKLLEAQQLESAKQHPQPALAPLG